MPLSEYEISLRLEIMAEGSIFVTMIWHVAQRVERLTEGRWMRYVREDGNV